MRRYGHVRDSDGLSYLSFPRGRGEPGAVQNLRAESDTLPRGECLRLLRSAGVGRILFTDSALPAATPVVFALDGQTVVFRATADSRLARAVDGAVVGFEVDHIDEGNWSGWSVLLIGVAEVLCARSEVRWAEQLDLIGGLGDERVAYVRITPGAVTGRRIGAPRVA